MPYCTYPNAVYQDSCLNAWQNVDGKGSAAELEWELKVRFTSICPRMVLKPLPHFSNLLSRSLPFFSCSSSLTSS